MYRFLPLKCITRSKTGNQTASFADWLDKMVFNSSKSLSDEDSDVLPSLDFAQTIRNWTSVFGQENIRIRPYEKSQLPNNILEDFMKACDLQDAEWLPLTKQQNITPSIKTLETIRYLVSKLDSSERYKSSRSAFVTQVRDTADRLGWNDQKLQIITPEIYEKIMEMFDEGNQEIARTFLGRGELFLEGYPTAPVTTFDVGDLTAEETMELLGPALETLLQRAANGRVTIQRISAQLYRYPGLLNFIDRHPKLAQTLKTLYQRL